MKMLIIGSCKGNARGILIIISLETNDSFFSSLLFICFTLRKLIASKPHKSLSVFHRLSNFTVSDVLLKSRYKMCTIIFFLLNTAIRLV